MSFRKPGSRNTTPRNSSSNHCKILCNYRVNDGPGVQEDPVLKINNLSKRFPGVQALDSVCLQIRKGEVHAVVGENGAGKSTLMKILAGAEKPDEGSIFVNGQKIENFDPQTARRMGIGIIFQEFNIIAYLSAAKNISLGREPHSLGWISNKNEINSAGKWLNEIEAAFPATAPVHRLSVGQQQQIEIAKALSLDAAILIMDEPASALSVGERRHLFTLIDKLRQNAITVVYVSHSLDEIFRISDRVTVLKDGQLVFTKPIQQTTVDDLITAMVGRQLDRVYPPKAPKTGKTLLSVKNLSSGAKLKDVSFELKKGEILGVYGLVGAGRTELCKALFGVHPSTGEISLQDEALQNRHPSAAIRNRMAFLTEDRKAEGLIMGLSLRENMALPSLNRRAAWGIIRHTEEKRKILNICQTLKIKTASIENDVFYLSGGNQQKVVIGKWLLAAPRILICDEPTRGVDVGAKMEIYAHLRDLADQGLAIILVSSELPEIIGMSDRILVMRNGKIACELDAAGVSEEKILAAGLGESGVRLSESPASGRPETHKNLLTKLNAFRKLMIQADWVVFLTLLCLVGIGIFTSESFLNRYNLTSIMRDAAALGIVSMGQAVVMIGGGLDISVGSIVSLTTILAALLINGSDAMIFMAVIVCLGAGMIVGFLNGVAVVKLKIVPFIATLGMMSVVHGVVLLIAHGPVGSVGKAFRFISRGSVGPFPSALLLLIFVFVVAVLVMNKTIYGRHLSATGANSEVARLAGIRISGVTFSSYLVSALCAVLAGLYLTSRMGMGDPLVGRGFEVDSIIAVLIGGVPFGGGRGNILGVIAGVLLLTVLGNLLNMWNLHSWYHQIVKAVILLVAISIYKQEGS
jgi:ABC-type sugar transport system ATPase subunit/ribose/xylose/arabinose/galactoside ABC-type transport system permease subunit